MIVERVNRLAIEIKNLSLRYGTEDIEILSDMSLSIQPGEFVALIGPSGCGKTSLLRLIADLVQPTLGEVQVSGGSPAEARLQRRLGYVFQAPALYPWRTVESNVAVPLEIAGVAKAERLAIARDRLAAVGLAESARRFPWQLSGGMQQRAAIARALSYNPDILLMDEPFGALDEITRDHLNLHLAELWRGQGQTCVFVTHSIAEAVFLATRVVVMGARPGRIIDDIDCSCLPRERSLPLRDSPEFQALAARVRAGLWAGHSYDDGA